MSDDNVVSVPSAALRLNWDVFLSFRGEDTRNNITESLYQSLTERGIRVFKDDVGMTQGDEIAPTLLEAIEDSAAAIIIFSPRYGDSHWCLEELARICELRRLVLPIFFQVNPYDVRRQRGPFEKDFASHSERFDEQRVAKWRHAMNKIGGLSGLVFLPAGGINSFRFLLYPFLLPTCNWRFKMGSYHYEEKQQSKKRC